MSRRVLLLALVAGFAIALTACSGDPQNVTISVEAPLQVKAGEKFLVKAHVKNTADKPQKLVSLDVGDPYLTGIAFEKTDPPFSDATHIPIDNTMSYTLNVELPSNEEKVVTFYAMALKTGDYSSKIDFCINSATSFLSYPVRTMVQ